MTCSAPKLATVVLSVLVVLQGVKPAVAEELTRSDGVPATVEETLKLPPSELAEVAYRSAIYATGKKEPWLAASLEAWLPLSGHSYTGNSARGIPYLVGALAGLILVIDGSDKVDGHGRVVSGAALIGVSRLGSVISAGYAARSQNRRLRSALRLALVPHIDDASVRPQVALSRNF